MTRVRVIIECLVVLAFAGCASAVTETRAPASTPVPAATVSAPAPIPPTIAPASGPRTPAPPAPSLRVLPVGAQQFELIPLRAPSTTSCCVITDRLWAVDPRLERTPELIAKWPSIEVGRTASATADGSRVAVSVLGPSGRAAIFVLDPRTGTMRSLVEDADADLLGPLVDRAGTKVAYTRRSQTVPRSANDGLYVVPLIGGAPRRVYADAEAYPQAAAWSADGAWLAFTPEGFPHTGVRQRVRVVAADGTRVIDTGQTGGIDWHPTEPRLLITQTAFPAGTVASVVSYDVPSGRAAPVYAPRSADAWLGPSRWALDGSSVVIVEAQPQGQTYDVLIARLGGATQRIGQVPVVMSAFWSSAGELILLTYEGPDVIGIRNLTIGRSIQLCSRSDDPVRCTRSRGSPTRAGW